MLLKVYAVRLKRQIKLSSSIIDRRKHEPDAFRLLDYYLIGVNLVGFILYLVNTGMYSHTADKEIDTVLTIVSLLGASLGIVLAILLFD